MESDLNNQILAGLRPVRRSTAFNCAVETALSFFEALDCSKSLAASILLRYGEYEQLVNLDVIPEHYNSAFSFKNAHAAVGFLSKFQHFEIKGLNRQARAIEKFKEAEALCKETNRRFRNLRVNPLLMDSWIRNVICCASRKIATVLGDLDLNLIAEGFGWGPGSTSSTNGAFTSAYNKFSGPLDVTTNCLIMGLCCVNSTPSWVNSVLKTEEIPSVPCSVLPSEFRIVKGDEIVFVPKNAKIDRAIGIPPHLNSYIQKGFGRFLRKRLKRFAGIDLDNQAINQRLAQRGSEDGSLATIDLSMASDTVSKELVRQLVPDEWFSALSACRSVFATIRETKEEFLLEKFSAMGNGYTFELESLIFWSLVSSTCEILDIEGPVSVYGDDIICPSSAYDRVVAVLNACGFRVNLKKSFSSGAFRESCGKDYYLGIDVRPIFLRENPSNVEALYRLANNLRRYSHSSGSYRYCDRRLLATWHSVVQRIPKYLRFAISETFGDLGLIMNFDESAPSHAKYGWEGFYCRALIRMPCKRRMEKEQVAYATLLSVIGGDTPLLGSYTLRASTYPKVARILVREWYDLGPWE